MCGIAGIYAYHYAANSVDRDELIAIREYMRARGPDGSGLWTDHAGRVGLAHRRLAIIDLSDNGHQPMHTTDGRLTITFNGEIYNYIVLRDELIRKGYVFRGHSDTEVLLHLYADRGPDMVRDLCGMFAFAIWDAQEKQLFLARDPYGIKPLYYCDDGWTFRFASQVKALLAGGRISREPDPAGIVGFHLLGSVPEPFTSLAAVRSVPAGTTMFVERIGAHTPKQYFSISGVLNGASPAAENQGEMALNLRAALLASVKRHLVADVAVGAFLSAGVDSSALVGLMRDTGVRDLQTLTVAFEEFRGQPQDEAPLAEQVAKYYATNHVTRIVARHEFEVDLPKIFEAMDQPSIDGVNTWFAAKAANERGLKVVISGLGGDELLGGYPSFRDIPRWVCRFALPSRIPFLGYGTRQVARRLAGTFGLTPKVAGMVELGGDYPGAYFLKRGLFMPWELEGVLGPEIAASGLRRLGLRQTITRAVTPLPPTAFARVAALESSLYMRNQLLRDTDWASMAHSIEVRVPLVDSALLEQVAPYARYMTGQVGKQILANAPERALPAIIATRPKTGFNTPIQMWNIPTNGSGRKRSVHWARPWSRRVAATGYWLTPPDDAPPCATDAAAAVAR